MSQIFSPKIVTKTPSRNRFNLSYYNHVTTRMGDLVPVLCKKILPGDRWRVSLSSVTRLAPLANPVYDRVRITYDAFFVQNRILDPDWKNFVSPDPELDDNPDRGLSVQHSLQSLASAGSVKPTPSAGHKFYRIGGLMDMLGFQFAEYNSEGYPPYFYSGTSGSSFTLSYSAYPLLGYFKIWDNWYRNERFQTSVYNSAIGTLNTSGRFILLNQTTALTYWSDYAFLNVNYGKDLYTTALESPLIGGPVNIPSGSDVVDVQFENDVTGVDDLLATAGQDHTIRLSSESTDTTPGRLVVDMKNAVLGTIQELKFAYSLFSFYMKDTYNGNRYVEFMSAHFGVHVPDATLERSIFLGRITQWINFSEIYQTSGSTGDTNALGDYAGVGVANGAGRLFDASFDEHGLLYILMSIRPNATYFQGVDRKFFYGDRFDELYFPEFQNIGDKPIYSLELFYDLSAVTPMLRLNWTNVNASKVFGYNRANSEYIWFHDEMHGNFLKEDSEFNWTFARRFSSEPVLGNEFSRVTAIQNPFTFTDKESLNYYTDILFDIKALRPIVRYEHY